MRDKRGEREKLEIMPLDNFTVADLAILSYLQQDPIRERYLIPLEELAARKAPAKRKRKTVTIERTSHCQVRGYPFDE